MICSVFSRCIGAQWAVTQPASRRHPFGIPWHPCGIIVHPCGIPVCGSLDASPKGPQGPCGYGQWSRRQGVSRSKKNQPITEYVISPHSTTLRPRRDDLPRHRTDPGHRLFMSPSSPLTSSPVDCPGSVIGAYGLILISFWNSCGSWKRVIIVPLE